MRALNLVLGLLLLLVQPAAWAALCSDVFSAGVKSNVLISASERLTLPSSGWTTTPPVDQVNRSLGAGDVFYGGDTVRNNNWVLTTTGSSTVCVGCCGSLPGWRWALCCWLGWPARACPC